MARKVGMALAQHLATLKVPPADQSLTSRGRNCTSTARCPFSRSVRVRDQASSSDVSPEPVSNRKLMREKLWREFFSDASQWWDNRSEKVNPRYPDFKHKRTGQSLWLDNSLTPPWVEAELGTMAPGLLQADIFSWHVRLRRHVATGAYKKTLDLFQQMQQDGMMPDKFTFVAVLSACSNLKSLEDGKRVHKQIIQRGCESEIYVANCLVGMYANCGSIECAWNVFSKMWERDVVSWNVMIGGYLKSEQGLKALELFREMQQEGVEPDAVTFIGALNACASVAALEEGRRVHEQISKRGCESDVFVANCLVDMYAKCGSIKDAWSMFSKMRERNVVSWTAMIGGYVKSEQGLEALELFRRMQQEGVESNTVTFVAVLNACASVAALEEGRRVHKQIIERGCQFDVYVANCLVDMYAKCGSITDAWSLFNKMPERDVVSWNAMIGGYVKSKLWMMALELFRKMQLEGVEPDTITFLEVLNACASIAAHEEGRRVHQQIIQRGYEFDVCVANCLVDMYAKCGSIKDARSVFNTMLERDVVSWNTMIGGYAMHGHSKQAIGLFKRMSKEGLEIDQITFTSLLSGCSHEGLVKEGLLYFKTMSSHYTVLPSREHYVCMVDLLGRAGWLQEAEELTKTMPMEGDAHVWMSLLGACRIHGNIEMAEQAARRCWELDPENCSAHLLSDVYAAAAGKCDRSAAMKKAQKEPRHTWVQVKDIAHLFVDDDNKPPQLLQVHAKLERLLVQMKEAGYILDLKFLLHEELKECYLCLHSEKLPQAFELVCTSVTYFLSRKISTFPERHGAISSLQI